MKKAPHNLPAAGAWGEQLTLIDPPEFSPGLPTPATLADLLLNHLLDGEAFTHPEWEALTLSWRLAASAQELRDLGWPVRSTPVMAPTNRNPDRAIARYSLPVEAIGKGRALYRPMRQRGAEGQS